MADFTPQRAGDPRCPRAPPGDRVLPCRAEWHVGQSTTVLWIRADRRRWIEVRS